MNRHLALLLALGFALPAAADEPTARGKPLSAWVEALKTPRTTEQALLALGEIGPAAKDARPLVRVRAAEALWKIDRRKEAVPVLAEVLEGKDANARFAAALAVGQVGPSAADAVPALVEAAGSPNAALANTARESLRQV